MLRLEADLTGLVHVVDDDASFRVAVERRLKLDGYQVIGYASAEDLLERLPDCKELGCILMDVRMPGSTGPELQSRLGELGSILPIVFLTGQADTATAVSAIKAGAEDFLIKPVPSERLIEAIERAMVRHGIACAQRIQSESVRARMANLTPREQQVFKLVVRGKINKQIAHEIGTTERTVKAHRHQVMEKMQAQSLAELVALADRLGILDVSNGKAV